MNYKCPECGKINTEAYCDACKKELSADNAINSETSDASSENSLPLKGETAAIVVEKTKNGKKKVLIAGSIVVILAIIVTVSIILLAPREPIPDFNELCSDLTEELSEDVIEIAKDGTWMKIDTNPLDLNEKKVMANLSDKTILMYQMIMNTAKSYVRDINSRLGFSESLIDKMQAASTLGPQTESNDKYTVSWTYSPDQGIEALYEIKH